MYASPKKSNLTQKQWKAWQKKTGSLNKMHINCFQTIYFFGI